MKGNQGQNRGTLPPQIVATIDDNLRLFGRAYTDIDKLINEIKRFRSMVLLFLEKYNKVNERILTKDEGTNLLLSLIQKFKKEISTIHNIRNVFLDVMKKIGNLFNSTKNITCYDETILQEVMERIVQSIKKEELQIKKAQSIHRMLTSKLIANPYLAQHSIKEIKVDTKMETMRRISEFPQSIKQFNEDLQLQIRWIEVQYSKVIDRQHSLKINIDQTMKSPGQSGIIKIIMKKWETEDEEIKERGHYSHIFLVVYVRVDNDGDPICASICGDDSLLNTPETIPSHNLFRQLTLYAHSAIIYFKNRIIMGTHHNYVLTKGFIDFMMWVWTYRNIFEGVCDHCKKPVVYDKALRQFVLPIYADFEPLNKHILYHPSCYLSKPKFQF